MTINEFFFFFTLFSLVIYILDFVSFKSWHWGIDVFLIDLMNLLVLILMSLIGALQYGELWILLARTPSFSRRELLKPFIKSLESVVFDWVCMNDSDGEVFCLTLLFSRGAFSNLMLHCNSSVNFDSRLKHILPQCPPSPFD
jgi:hypothetical protein